MKLRYLLISILLVGVVYADDPALEEKPFFPELVVREPQPVVEEPVVIPEPEIKENFNKRESRRFRVTGKMNGTTLSMKKSENAILEEQILPNQTAPFTFSMDRMLVDELPIRKHDYWLKYVPGQMTYNFAITRTDWNERPENVIWQVLATNGGANCVIIYPTGGLVGDQWNHWLGIYNTNSIQLYLNGTLVGNQTCTTNLGSSYMFHAPHLSLHGDQNDYDANPDFDSVVDNFKFWPYALTHAQAVEEAQN